MLRRLLSTLLLLPLAGCCSGMLGARVFTPDGKYLVWEEPSPSRDYPTIKRTECSTGRTIELAKGGFVPDRSREYVLCLQWGKGWLVRIADARSISLTDWPNDTRPALHVMTARDLQVESFDPPHLRCLTMPDRSDEVATCEYREGAWRVVDSRHTGQTRYLMGREQSDKSSVEVENGTRVEKTPSPDGRHVLVECKLRLKRYAELREVDGKRAVRLVNQTNQLSQVLDDAAVGIWYICFDGLWKICTSPRYPPCTTQDAPRTTTPQPSLHLAVQPSSALAEPGEPTSQPVQ
jgi:hypothetical protein